VLDWRQLRAGKAAWPDVLLAAERTGQPGILALGRFATVGLPWTPFIAMRFALVRRSLIYARAREGAVADQLHEQVRSVREQIERASDPALWRALPARRAQAAPAPPQGSRLRRYWQLVVSLVLLLPSLLFLIVGGFPATSGIQRWFATPAVFGVLTVFSVATLLMVGWNLIRTVWGIPRAFRAAYADPAVSVTFRSGIGVGALAVGALSLSNVLGGATAKTPILSSDHILDAIRASTNLLGNILLAMSLLALFAAFMGGTGGLGGALVAAIARIGAQELLQAIAVAGISTLGALGLILAMASGGDSSGGSRDGSEGESKSDGKPEGQRELTDDEKWEQAERARDQQTAQEPPPGPEVAERYPTVEDAIGQVDGNATVIDKVQTQNPGLRSQGFTETWYVEDSQGTQWTVARNPHTGEFTGAHPSSSN
jgi:hypothetical protein